MLRRQAQLTLRQEVTGLLRRIQALPELQARLRELRGQPLPDASRHWPWWAVLQVCHGSSPGTVGAEWVPLEDLRAEDWDLAEDLSGNPDLTCERKDGVVMARRYFAEPAPAKVYLPVITSYQERVTAFAQRFVFNANCAPRMVHDAIRLGEPLRLPQPRPPVIKPVLGDDSQELDDAAGHLASERTWVRARARQELARDSARSASAKQLEEALDDYVSRFDPPEMYSVEKLRGDGRTQCHEKAIESVRSRLGGGPAVYREQFHRAGKDLDVAVNGTRRREAAPIEPTDDPAYFTALRPLKSRALTALLHAHPESR